MEKDNRARVLYLLKLLEEYSDDTHPLSLADLSRLLMEKHGLEAHRITLSKDIAALIDAGVDIVTVRSTQNRYFIGERVFEIPELRLLIDAILSSKCLSEKKSRVLTDKLLTLVSRYQATSLRERPMPITVSKPKNEQVYYIVDAINHAIDQQRKLSFSYTEYTPAKELVLRNDGEIYLISPYACLWNGDYYYVIGWSDKHDSIAAFRVDRIASTPCIRDEAAVAPPPDFDPTAYCKSIFHMFKGVEATVELLCENALMKTVIDRFGDDVATEVYDDEHFKVTTSVSLSPTFYAWVFEFKGSIRLLSPEHAKAEFRRMLDDAYGAL